MRRFVAACTALLMVAALGLDLLAWRGNKLDEPRDDQQSLLFGFIDVQEGPGLEWAKLQQASPRVKEPVREMRIGGDPEGLFYLENVPIGSFQLYAFGGSSYFRGGSRAYAFDPFDRNKTAVKIERPGIYCLGVYRFDISWENTRRGRIGTWSINPRAYPGEATLLKQLLPGAAGTKWEARIRARIEALANPAPPPPAVPPLEIIMPEPGK